MDDQAGPDTTGSASQDPVSDDQQTGAAESTAPGTGDRRVDAALSLLDRLPGLPVDEHAPVFEQVHAELTEILGDVDADSAGTSG